jgi:ferritin-like metal-binding protein YciE
VTDANLPSNIPNPDPSVVANERLEEAKVALRREISANRDETQGWIDRLQVILERDGINLKMFLVEKIEGGLRNIGTRLDGNDTALVAALKAQKEEAAKQTENFKEVLGESKKGTEKQFDSLNEKIEDYKDRLNRVEAMNLGATYNRSEHHDQTTIDQHRSQNNIAIIAAAIGAAGILIALGSIIYTASRPAAPGIIYSQPGETPR